MILKMSRTGIIVVKLPKRLWDKALDSTGYEKNRLLHTALGSKMPIEVLLKRDLVQERQNLQPFGHRVNIYNYKVRTSDKFAPRIIKGRIVR